MPLKDPTARKAYAAAYAKANPAYLRVKAWRAKNPEQVKKHQSTYVAAHPEVIAAKTKRYRERHLVEKRKADCEVSARYRAKNREKVAATKKTYAQSNKHKINASVACREAAKAQRTPAWLTDDDHWMIEQAYELAALRTKMFGMVWHVDHVIPLRGKTVSGLHTPYNLQVIMGSENCRKGNRVQHG
jgi:hypothetical protein